MRCWPSCPGCGRPTAPPTGTARGDRPMATIERRDLEAEAERARRAAEKFQRLDESDILVGMLHIVITRGEASWRPGPGREIKICIRLEIGKKFHVYAWKTFPNKILLKLR